MPAIAAAVPSILINEVESNGDDFDWVELINTGTESVDVSGWVLKDDKDDRTLTLPVDSSILAGGYLAVDVNDDANPDNFGLGKADTARVFLADGVTLVDSYAWDGHATVTYGRCANGTGEFRDTVASTKGAANACEITADAAVRINEIESSGEAADWIELTNISNFTVDVSGLVLKDDKDSGTDEIPSGTTIEPGAFYAFEPSFGLGSSDAARVFQTDGATRIDSYSWTTHASSSYGRCPDGVGEFATTNSTTRGAANDCGAAELPGVRINEIESNGDATDWVELVNSGSSAVDISGWIIQDNDDSHLARIPAATVLAAGDFYVFDQPTLSFGLGTADSVRVFAADGFTAIDSRSWSGHSPTTLGVCGADFGDTTSATKGAANDCSPPIRINEVESSGDSSDWIELKNNGSDEADVSGFILKDNDDSHVFTLAAGTTIAAGDYLVVEPDFGLGGGDSARLFSPDGVTLVDSYVWTSHAITTYARCPDGTGDFETSKASTKGAANSCVGELETAPWPGGSTVTAVNELDEFSDNMSGLAFEAAPSGDVLWAAKNGPGSLYKLVFDGANWVPATSDSWSDSKRLHYSDGSGDVDAEGVALTAAGASEGVFIASERDNSNSGVSRPTILRYDVSGSASELTASQEWNLTADLPVTAANSGLEGIAWIPDSYLVAEGFIDESTNALYSPATYADHGDGLFFVGLEANGAIYAYALDQTSGSYQRVATIESGFVGVMELEFDAALGALWAVCDDTCEGRSALLEIVQDGAAKGLFEVATVFERPSGMLNLNNEGFAVVPHSECVSDSTNVYWSDDSNTGGIALRSGTVDCTVTTDPTDSTDPTIPTTPVAVPAASLVEANRGAITAPASAKPGETITITMGASPAGTVVNTWIYSTPTLLGSPTVSAAGTVSATLPLALSPGAHRLVVTATDGSLIGWADITITALEAGSLAFTGSGSPLPIQLPLMMLIAGFAMVMIRRREAGVSPR
ncbi:lamin tail domain-containing protein [Salinibacterium sp. UTAS2018]|uniref:lamin tail domain-containing protein n=1 Tax=Salinibacterium sp. UTAS2018 TaxID=2508880 RepID=UPI00143D28C7|nr:lamin tail domain-containing protein [Salinibacterium sp. UTAS2018]